MRYTVTLASDFESWSFPTPYSKLQQLLPVWQEHFFPIEIHVHPSGYAQVVVVYGRDGDHLRMASSIFAYEWAGGVPVGATPIATLQRIELGFVGILPAETNPNPTTTEGESKCLP